MLKTASVLENYSLRDVGVGEGEEGGAKCRVSWTVLLAHGCYPRAGGIVRRGDDFLKEQAVSLTERQSFVEAKSTL